ncbi:MAG: SDR family oxidoreductase [Mycobacteriales bacterium]|nr:MAG: ABC transporter substrate-binding protein [Pseudonocardiales bacterium]
MDLGLTGRRAIVTGGSKGIGLAVAKELASEGARVAICSRNGSELASAAEAIGNDTFHHVADVTRAGDVQAFVDAAAEALGGVDILVNNAGGAHPGNFEALTDDDWHGDLDVKLFSQIRCFRAALDHLKRSGSARVVNINAVYGKYPDPAFFATTVIRAACLNLNKVLAQEFAGEGILVNSVNIGFVDTPQWDNIHSKRAPDISKETFFARLADTEVPLRRFGTVDEVSGLVCFLAGSRASYITGAVIDVAGGMGKYV